ncbi:MAG: hypothetical protein ACXVAY_04855 [Mucilaginibacter sp.]
MMLRFLYLICFILLFSTGTGMAATPAKTAVPKAVLHNDTTKVNQRNFNQAALKNYSKQPEFQYNGVYTGPSLWRRFWNWVWHWINAFLSSGNNGSIVALFFKYLFIALGLGALAFLILRLVGVDALNIFRNKAVSANIPYAESLENIHEIDFDSEIERATAQHNYRFAVRLLYLKCLKQLSDAGQIQWEINKTNSVYINELTNAEQRIAFNLLTRQFEYIWYGDFIIDAPVFQKVNALFHDFKSYIA